MKTYRNKLTGAILLSDSDISGDWELLDGKESKVDYTTAELKSLLTELGVAFDPKAKKTELLELYEANKAE